MAKDGRKIEIKINLRQNIKAIIILGIVVFFIRIFLFFGVASAGGSFPNPGHPWTQIGDGNFIVAGLTDYHTFTFPDATSTVLTTHDLVTVPEGGTGIGSFLSGGILIGNGSGAISVTTNPTIGFITATSTTASSTFANGVNLTGGCFAVGGNCIAAGGVTSVTNSDGTLTVVPTSGAVVASLNLAHTNTWTGAQTFSALTNLSGQASTTLFSSLNGIYIGTTATTTILGNGATSTFSGGIQTTALNVTSGTASSTFANGINIATGCISIAGTCIGTSTGTVSSVAASGGTTGLSFGGTPITTSGTLTLSGTLVSGNGGTGISTVAANQLLIGNSGGTGWIQVATSSLGLLTTNVGEGTNLYYTDVRVNSYINGSSTIPKTYTANTFSGLQTFNGGVTLGSLTGILQGINGVVSASSTLAVAYGGTGWNAIQAGSIPYGNGSGALSTTSAGNPGNVLALLNGVPTWTASTTFSSPLIYSAGNVTCQASGASQAGCLSSADWNTFNNKVGSKWATTTNLSAITPNGGTTIGLVLGRAATTTNSLLEVNGTTTATLFVSTSTTGASVFPFASTTALTVSGANGLTLASGLTGPLQAINGLVSSTSTLSAFYGGTGISNPTAAAVLLGAYSGVGWQQLGTSSLGLPAYVTGPLTYSTSTATISLGTVGVANGGTGATTFGQGWVYSLGGTGALNSSTSPTVNYVVATSTTIASQFPYASTTALTVSSANGLTLASGLNGPLQAVNGLVSATSSLSVAYGGTGITNPTAAGILLGSYAGGGWQQLGTSSLGLPAYVASPLIYSTSTATISLGTVGISNGGTGFTTYTKGDLLYSDNTNSLGKLGIGTGGFILASVNGVPGWVATTTFSSPLIYSAGNVTCQASSGSQNGCLSSADWNTFNSKVSSKWATTTNLVALTPSGGTNIGLVIGRNATTTNSLLEVNGTTTALLFTATSTTGASTFPFASTTALTVSGVNGLTLASGLTGSLQAINGLVSATSTLSAFYGGTGISNPTAGSVLLGAYSGVGWQQLGTSSLGLPAYVTGPLTYSTSTATISLGTIGVANGGTGATTFGQGWIYSLGGTGALSASTSPTVNYVVATSSTIASQFPFASTTALTVSGANGLTLASALTGNLQAINGVVSSTSTLSTAFGGTGWSNIQNGALLYGSTTNALATTAAGTAGNVLAFLNGIPTWTATTTFSSPLIYSAASGNVTCQAASGSQNGCLSSTDWNTFNTKVSSQWATTTNLVALTPNGGTNIGLVIGRNATTTNSLLEVNGTTTATLFVATSTTGTSTFSAGFQTTALNVTSTTASSTFGNGINLANGCFAISGTCLSTGGGGSGTVNSGTLGQFAFYAGAGTAVSGTSTLFAATNSNIGIGSTTPWARLSVNGSAAGSAPLFAVGSSTAGFATSTAFLVDQNGLVGIGTTSPTQQLSVSGNGLFSGLLSVTNLAGTSTFSSGLQAAALNITSATASSTFANGINLTGGCFAVNNNCVGGSGGSVNTVSNSDGTLTISPTSGSVVASLNLANSNTWTSQQLFNTPVGIGTSSPSAMLSVSTSTASSGNTVLFAVASSTNDTLFSVLGNGNLTIGTTSQVSIDPNHPAKLLIDTGTSQTEEGINVIGNVNDFLENNVKNLSTGSSAQACQSVTTDNGTNLTGFLSMCSNNSNFYNPQTYNVGGAGDTSLMSLSAGDMYIDNGTAGKELYFMTGGSATTTNIHMTINSSGNVGIGTTSPFSVLSVSTSTASSPTTSLFAVASSSNDTLFNILGNGNIGIGGTTSPSKLLAMNGGDFLQVATGTPVVVSTVATTTNFITISGKYAYTVNSGSGLNIFDLSTSTPALISNTYATTSSQFAVAGKYLYSVNNTNFLTIYDISNKSSPNIVATYALASKYGIIKISGKYAYLAAGVSGTIGMFEVVDISNPIAPKSLAHIGPLKTLIGSPNTLGFNDMAISNNYVYLADSDGGFGGFDAIDISNPSSPFLVFTGFTSGNGVGVVVSGGYAYVAEGSKIQIFNISKATTTAPVVVSSLTIPNGAANSSLAIAGKYLYVAGAYFHVIDISNPKTPIVVSNYSLPFNSSPTFLDVSGKYAYVGDLSGGMLVFDLNGIDTPAINTGLLQTEALAVIGNATFANNAFINGSLTVGQGGLNSQGSGNFSLFATSSLSSVSALSAGITDSNSSSVVDVFNISHLATSTAANGVGTGLLFSNQDSSGAATSTSRIASIFTNVNTASPTSALTFSNKNTVGALTEMMRLDSTGNLGIGTTTPWATLSVGTNNLATTLPSFVIASSSTGLASTTQFIVTDGLIGIGTSTPGGTLSVAGAPGQTRPVFLISTSSAGSAVSTAFVIDSNGFVGVGGTTSPSGFLSIQNTTDSNSLYISDQLNDPTPFVVDQNGSVGIGTSTPGAVLAVNGLIDFDSNSIDFSSSTAKTTLDLNFATSTAIILPNNRNNIFSISTSTANVPIFSISTVNSGVGVVGIGSSTPWAKLSVEMGLHNPAFVVSNQGSTTPSFIVTGVNQNGVVGIGTSTPSSLFDLSVAGSTYLGSGTTSILTAHVGTINYLTNSTTTIHDGQALGFSIASSTLTGVSPLVSYSTNGATSTISFFTATSTGLFANQGLALPTTTRNMIIIGSGSSNTSIHNGQAAALAVVNGSICVDNDGWCQATSTGSVTALRFNTNASDLAENYYSNQPLEPGDIVMMTGQDTVAKSTAAYESKMLGIVSTNPGMTLGADYESTHQYATFPIALTGRVPIKVNMQGGPIKVGDYLTSSQEPGVAMKAGKAGVIIGQALEDYNSPNDGLVLAFTKVGYYNGVALSTLVPGMQASNANGFDVALLNQFIQNPAQNQSSQTTSEIFTDKIAAGISIITPKIVAQGLTIDSISARDKQIAFNNDVVFFGRPYFTTDTAGFATIKKGDRKVDISFDNPYIEQPIVNASLSLEVTTTTPQSALEIAGAADALFKNNVQYVIAAKSTGGFSIIMNKLAEQDIEFSWTAFAVKGAKDFLSKGDGALDTSSSEAPAIPPISPIIPTTVTAGTVPPSTTATDTTSTTTTVTVGTSSAPIITPPTVSGTTTASTTPVVQTDTPPITDQTLVIPPPDTSATGQASSATTDTSSTATTLTSVDTITTSASPAN